MSRLAKTFDWREENETLRWESDNYFLKCTSFQRNTPIAFHRKYAMFACCVDSFFLSFSNSNIVIAFSTTKNVSCVDFFNFVDSPVVEVCLCFRVMRKLNSKLNGASTRIQILLIAKIHAELYIPPRNELQTLSMSDIMQIHLFESWI